MERVLLSQQRAVKNQIKEERIPLRVNRIHVALQAALVIRKQKVLPSRRQRAIQKEKLLKLVQTTGVQIP